ncbi:MAG: hypothetical protein ACC656_07890, partial [Candidatus Heimdallarchaeota archaeon]
TLLDTYTLTYITIDEFRVVRVIDEDWFYFITPDIVYQWHPNYELDVISEENARYLIAHLDERVVEPESAIQSSINYPIQIFGSETIKEDRFGFSAALSNDKLIVGAPDNYSGIAYLFNQGTNGLSEVDSIRYDESTTGNADLFATSISIENNIVVIGAPATNTTTGEVYVYDITSNQFTLVDILSETSTIGYGYKVFISNNTIFVSAPVINEVYVYQLNISWELTQTITSPSTDLNQQFGASLHVENDILVIGAPNSNSGLGEVFVYQFDGTQWNYLTDLSKNDASEDNDFGTSVFVYDPFIFVGATGDSADTNNGSGSVYVFRQDTLTSWSEASKIKPDDSNQTTSQFGSAIYYDSVKLFVGAPSYDIATFSSEGAVYTYAEQGFNNWVKLDLITSPNPKLTGQFGQSVVANNSIWFTGELNDNYSVHNQLPTGYVYENIIEMLPGGTDGTSGLVDRYVQLSWVKQGIKYPTRIEKNVKYLTDYQNWQKESEFFIYDDFSKT